MNELKSKVTAKVEKMMIPTYTPPAADEAPMYSEFRHHQGTTGYAYPNRVTTRVERSKKNNTEYTVVRLENAYIRLLIIPALGGRIFEAYDKKNNYNFLYRQTVIKPALVGAYGNWISGGMEFNFPFHHRPATYMPVDYEIEEQADGTAIVWLAESAPSPGQYRLRELNGIVLRPDKAYFATRVKIDNRTPNEYPFLWWENAAVHVNDSYQLFFPQDVHHVHHHYDRHHATFPLHEGLYAIENHPKDNDISKYKNTITGNSYFAGPSHYDFFGGYDHSKECGTIHIGDHHVVPGKKMFVWGHQALADAWLNNLTDSDGPYAELMAGAFSDDQPDFSWIVPYEVKTFSQYWYPISKIGVPIYANLDVAISIDKENSKLKVISTGTIKNAVLKVKNESKIILKEHLTLTPAEYKEFVLIPVDGKVSLSIQTDDGVEIMEYTEDRQSVIRLPNDNMGIPTPHKLKTAQDVYLAGRHIELYRDPVWHSNEYYEVALEKDAEYLPALLGMAKYYCDNAFYKEAITSADKALAVHNRYDTNPVDGTYSYRKGLAEFRLHDYDKAYETLYKACWSSNAIAWAMPFISAIDSRRGKWLLMKKHAEAALAKEKYHAVAGTYAAIAEWKLGNGIGALQRLSDVIQNNKLDQLAKYVYGVIKNEKAENFIQTLHADPSETCIDIAVDLMNAGFYKETTELIEGLKKCQEASAMALYLLAYAYEKIDNDEKSAQNRQLAVKKRIVDIFPYRLAEIDFLKAALRADESDATAAYLLGCILYDKRHYKEAEKVWKQATKSDPKFYLPYRNLAIVYYSKLGKREEALEYLLKANKLKLQDDTLVKETNYVMAHLGTNIKKRLDFILKNRPDDKISSDRLVWGLANAYSYDGQYTKALETLATHYFVAAECCEVYLTESYTFACFALGCKAMTKNKLQEALKLFQKGQIIPENFHAGWWDRQNLYYVQYYEAKILMELGRKKEATAIAEKLTHFIHSAYSPHMGPDVEYYVASAHRLLGDELRAVKHMSKYVTLWEKGLENTEDCKLVTTALYWSYVDDPVRMTKAELLFALGYSRMFFGDKAGAKKMFEQSLFLNPANIKVLFELKLLADE